MNLATRCFWQTNCDGQFSYKYEFAEYFVIFHYFCVKTSQASNEDTDNEENVGQ